MRFLAEVAEGDANMGSTRLKNAGGFLEDMA
jgi:hypothetical protein